MQGPSSHPGNDDITREEPLQWGFTCLLLTALSSAADPIQGSLLHWANWLWRLWVFPCFSWLIKNSGELLCNSSWSWIPRCLEAGDVPLGGIPRGLLSAQYPQAHYPILLTNNTLLILGKPCFSLNFHPLLILSPSMDLFIYLFLDIFQSACMVPWSWFS